MDETMSLFDIYEEKLSEITDEFQLVYETDMEVFSNRMDFAFKDICEKTDALHYFSESTEAKGLLKKMLDTIREFIHSIQESLSKLFTKSNMKDSLNELSRSENKSEKILESDIDYEAYAKFDAQMDAKFKKAINGVNSSNIGRRTEEIRKLTEEYEEAKKKKRFSVPKVLTIGALVAVGAYFLRNIVGNDRYKSAETYIKKEQESIEKSDKNITENPIEVKEKMGFLKSMSQFIHKRESDVSEKSSKLASDVQKGVEKKKEEGRIKRSIRHSIETKKGYFKVAKNTAKMIWKDEDRKATYDARKKAQEERERRHDEAVEKETKKIDKLWKKIPREES